MCRYVMNVTDVDDKIIVRARRNWLLDQYQQRTADIGTVRCCYCCCLSTLTGA